MKQLTEGKLTLSQRFMGKCGRISKIQNHGGFFLDLTMENDEKQHYFLLVFYDLKKTSYHLSMNQNFLLFAGKCRVDRF